MNPACPLPPDWATTHIDLAAGRVQIHGRLARVLDYWLEGVQQSLDARARIFPDCSGEQVVVALFENLAGASLGVNTFNAEDPLPDQVQGDPLFAYTSPLHRDDAAVLLAAWILRQAGSPEAFARHLKQTGLKGWSLGDDIVPAAVPWISASVKVEGTEFALQGQKREYLEVWGLGLERNVDWQIRVTPPTEDLLRVVLLEEPDSHQVLPTFLSPMPVPEQLMGLPVIAYSSPVDRPFAGFLMGAWMAAWTTDPEEARERAAKMALTQLDTPPTLH